MASAQLTIAKASLLAALLKPDTTSAGADADTDSDASLPSCSRDEIEQLHSLLSAAVTRCSPANVQKCKQWLLQNLVRSHPRSAALGKYLVAYANSFSAHPKGKAGIGDAKQKDSKPSAKRKRLHILYTLSDVFFHLKFRTQTKAFFIEIKTHLPALLKSAAAFTNAPKHEKKLRDLIQLWEQKNYFSSTVLDQLREAAAEGPEANETEAAGDVIQKAPNTTAARYAPFILPSMHGDPSTPWYDLPAANWLTVLEPNSTRPMNPSMIRPLQLAGGPADKSLVKAVKKLLGEVDKIYAKEIRHDEEHSGDIGQMGEVIERDELGDIVGGDTYYGWSRTFCEKMRARRRKGDSMEVDDDGRGRRSSSRFSSRSRSRSRGRSSSRGSSRPAIKRRRLSGSRSLSRSRSRSGSWSGGTRGWRRSRSYSRSHSRPHSARRRSQDDRDSYSPPPALPNNRSYHIPGQEVPPLPPPPPPINNNHFLPPKPPQHHYKQPPPPPPPNFPGNFPPNMSIPLPPQQLAQGGWNVPPPLPPLPPPQYRGQWPPPPPPGMPGVGVPQVWYPPTNAGGSLVPNLSGNAPWGGGWASSPPPPHHHQQQSQGGDHGYTGRGGGGNGGFRGRGGGYGRGRGW